MIVAKPVAKPVSLTVRPFQVSHLCFEVGGILGESFVELGDDVSEFDFSSFYQAFRDATLAPQDEQDGNGRLRFDSAAIDLATKIQRDVHADPPIFDDGPALAALRAEPLRTSLDKAINARANAVITKYANAGPIIREMKETAKIKLEMLTRLKFGIDFQTNLLIEEYKKDGLTDDGAVVKDVTNKSDTRSIVRNRNILKTHTVNKDVDAAGKEVVTSISDSTVSSVPAPPPPPSEEEVGHQFTNTTTRQIEYRVPILECTARNERAQIMLRDEQFANFLEIQNLDRLEEIFKNELALIDADVNQLQIAYLNTILLSPIKGTVTGVYKNPGDKVSPGEPVFRVENDEDVLIVAQVVYSGAVLIGSILAITTTLFDANGLGSVRSIDAIIVAARGQGDDDQWEVIGKASNIDATGKRILPLGYHFDNDITSVFIADPNDI